MIYLNMFLIVVFTICVVDLSGFVDSFKSGIKYILTKGKFSNSAYSLKPFDCSLCMSFWLQMAYLLYCGEFSILSMTIGILFSINTITIKSFLELIRDLIITIINVIYKKID